MFVGDVRFIFSNSVPSLVRRFACEESREIVNSRKENPRRWIRWWDGSEGGGDGRSEQRIATSRIHCLFTVIHCSWSCSKTVWFLQAIVGTEVARNHPSIAPANPENSLL